MTSSASCVRPGCTGRIEDGYCNVCGLAPAASSPAVPVATSARASRPSAPTGSRPGRTSRSTATRGNLGAGLVQVPPVPYRDPGSVILAIPELPESKRFCGACGQPVGRTRGDKPARTEGFCAHCGHPFSFTPKLRPGEVAAGQYEVVGPIAYGGLGWIYLARDRNVSDRWVVLKGLLDGGDPSAMAAAIAERRFLARVEHPNIVRIYNFITHDSAGYIVMEYVGGASLKDLRRSGPLPVAQAIAYALEILPALGYLHSQGLLYCDFKPDNVMQNEEQLKLIDLGGVRSLDDDQSDLYGTVGYQAPEVAETGASIASDLYTVARTLAVLSFDFRGFQDPSRFATTLPPAGDVEVLVRYEAYDRFLRKGANPDPAARFASAAEMAEQLLGVLRQVIAVDGEKPDPAPSRVFTAELLRDPAGPGWRDLPTPVVDAGDEAAGLLAGLAAAPPEQLIGVLTEAPATPETRFQLVRAYLERGEIDESAAQLRQAEETDPRDWRLEWWRGVLALAAGRAADARAAFELTAAELPGELAPLMAMAVAAEAEGVASGALPVAASLYQLVVATDVTYAGAAFGLGRVRATLGDRAGSSAALAHVPSSSSFHRAATETRCRVMLSDVGGGPPSAADLAAAGEILRGLDTDKQTRLELTRALLTSVLDGVVAGGPEPSPAVLPEGVAPTPQGIRSALEHTYRSLARLAAGPAERIALVDRANACRPRTLI